MASILNNSARKYSLAYGKGALLKVLPGLNTYESSKKSELNKDITSEKEFEDALKEVSKIEYVKILRDNGTFVINLKSSDGEKPKRKTKKKTSKKKKETKTF
ncbi:hypothetical protein GWN42_13620 [candidate division KSB1 bacterium]|nr:hypothetical protein [candidate division KSB1 bacterium]